MKINFSLYIFIFFISMVKSQHIIYKNSEHFNNKIGNRNLHDSETKISYSKDKMSLTTDSLSLNELNTKVNTPNGTINLDTSRTINVDNNNDTNYGNNIGKNRDRSRDLRRDLKRDLKRDKNRERNKDRQTVINKYKGHNIKLKIKNS